MIAGDHSRRSGRPSQNCWSSTRMDGLAHARRADFADFLRAGDVVVANDAATLPASLYGVHDPTGAAIEVRLASRPSLRPAAVRYASAVVFGAGDFHTPTEHRPLPPALHPGDRLTLGPLAATVTAPSRASAFRVDSFRRDDRRRLGGPRPARPPHSIRPHGDTTGNVGRLDRGGESPGGIRAAVGGFRARLANADQTPRARHRVRHAHARCRHLVHRRCGARCDAAVRRAVHHSVIHGGRNTSRARGRTPRRRCRHDGRTGAGAGGPPWRSGSSGAWSCDAAHRPGTRRCSLSMRSFQACTNRRRATISCCARLPASRRCSARTRRWRLRATGRTNSATRC